MYEKDKEPQSTSESSETTGTESVGKTTETEHSKKGRK